MDKIRFFLLGAALFALCSSMRAEPTAVATRAASPSALSSLARHQTFTCELRNVYLTQNIDSMSTEGKTRSSVDEGFQTQKNSGTQGKTEFNGRLKLWGIPSFSLKGAVSASGGYSQDENQCRKSEQELSEDLRLGKYHLIFSVEFRNHDPNDTLDIKGGAMKVYLSGSGLPGEIPVPYTEREKISLEYGETLCVFDYEIKDLNQFESLRRLENQGGLQLLGLKVSGTDFPVVSRETGKNVLVEQAKWEHNHPSTLVSIDFGELAGLSPWRVSRRHTKETGSLGTPVTLREALLAVEGSAERQSETLPEDIFTFSDKGYLATVVDRPLLDRDEDGNYRLFAVLLTNEKGKSEPHLPLSGVLDRNIKDYSEISLFEFTLDELAQNAVLLPAHFAEVKREIKGWLEESGEKEARQHLKDALEKRQTEDDNRDLPKEKESISAADVKRYRLRAEAGVTNMQYKLAVCLLNGWGAASNHVEAVKWFRKAAEQGQANAQNCLGICYEHGTGVAKDEAQAVKWYRKAAEQGNAQAQYNLGNCYYDGKGVIPGSAEAMKWAQLLGVVALNRAEAAKWYEQAAKQGNAPAQFKLGMCYLNGDGVPKDRKTGLLWLQRSGVMDAAADASPLLRRLLKDR